MKPTNGELKNNLGTLSIMQRCFVHENSESAIQKEKNLYRFMQGLKPKF